MTSLSASIANYNKLLKISNTSQASLWTIEFIEQCTYWCIFIETELSALNAQDREQCIIDIHNQATTEDNVASLEELLHAQHHFYKTLLKSNYINNAVYHFILNHYCFLSNPTKGLLIEVKITRRIMLYGFDNFWR